MVLKVKNQAYHEAILIYTTFSVQLAIHQQLNAYSEPIIYILAKLSDKKVLVSVGYQDHDWSKNIGQYNWQGAEQRVIRSILTMSSNRNDHPSHPRFMARLNRILLNYH